MSMISQVPISPVFMETPASAIPKIGRETVYVEGRSIMIERPIDADRLLDDPMIREANIRDDYMPYWADIWPASRMMAKAILRERWAEFPLRGADKIEALEIGCGLGVAGIAALMQGLRVTFSDYDVTALRFAARNARLNGFTDFRTLPLDWRFPPEDQKFAVIIAADLTYELRNIDPLLALVKKLLLPGGICLLTDPDRTHAPKLRERLAEENLVVATEFIRAGEPGGYRTKGTLYRIGIRD
jgi:predicted nicotinamide N-methyase